MSVNGQIPHNNDMEFAEEPRYLSNLLEDPINSIYQNKIISITVDHCLVHGKPSYVLRETIQTEELEYTLNFNELKELSIEQLEYLIGNDIQKDKRIIEKIPLNSSLAIKIALTDDKMYLFDEYKLLEMTSCSENTNQKNMLTNKENHYYYYEISKLISVCTTSIESFKNVANLEYTYIKANRDALFSFMDKVFEVVSINKQNKAVLDKIKARTNKFIQGLIPGFIEGFIPGRVEYCKKVLVEIMQYLHGEINKILFHPNNPPSEDLDEILKAIKDKEGGWMGGSRQSKKNPSHALHKTKKLKYTI